MSTATQPADRDEVLANIDLQIGWCRTLGSPFTAEVLALVRDEIVNGGALASLVVPWHGPLPGDALALRIAGALHALARSGRAPALAAFYPPSPRKPWDAGAAGVAIKAAVAEHRAFVADFLTSPPQTNEVGRSAALTAGYVELARRTGLPLRVLEVGASAGLNLMWDRYAYRLGERTIGPSDAALVLAPEWRGTPPAIGTLPTVAERRGCDQAPIDVADPAAAERLIAYVWPDQIDRLERLEAAIAVARAARPPIDRADAADWLERTLATPTPGMATVVAHTIVWQYFPRPTAERARRAIEDAGARATAERPIAWLALEQSAAEPPTKLTLTIWPGGERCLLARVHPHGAWIEWVHSTAPTAPMRTV